ncbi:MAG TPA: biopolymer transporter ExbD [Pirellulales bacterium]|nr:biopolymer transporter ExbD [Pirellulales bacterium]
MAKDMELKVVALDRVYAGVSSKTLVAWAMQGRIAPDDLVRKAGHEHWHRVADVPELALHLPHGLAREPADDDEEKPEQDVDEATSWTVRRLRHRGEEAEMDMTPMIDVTFQLLIFFMLTNHLANPAPIDVPEAVYGRGIDAAGRQSIVVDEQGRYYLGDAVSPENLSPSLDSLAGEVARNASAADHALDVIVSAHKKAKYARIKQLVERLGKISNLGKVMLGVTEKH